MTHVLAPLIVATVLFILLSTEFYC